MIKKDLFKCIVLSGSIILLFGGCKTTDKSVSPVKAKFTRLFCWGVPNNEKNAEKYASAGVTDIMVKNKNQYDLALKYGMKPYWNCFTPEGPHPQVISPDEEKYHAYIHGKDLDPKMPYSKRMEIIFQRRLEKNHRYGGEMVGEIDTFNIIRHIPCFISDEGLVLSRKKIDSLLEKAPSGVCGMFLDYIGYTNHQGCYCKECLLKYQKYLTERKLSDTPENKTAFYREKMVEYYNKVIDYIKSKRPDFKIVVHIYPDFKNDPLFGNRTKADYCGQTVSWYFKFSEPKIRRYTKFVIEHAKDYYSFVEGIPFIGVAPTKTGSLTPEPLTGRLASKTPEEVEQELRIILSAGGRTLLVCNGDVILKDRYYEVFRKYCGKE